MDKQTQKNNAADLAALNERPIKPIELLQEIYPLIKEYFICKSGIENNALALSFENGQQFKVLAEEVY